MRLLLFFLLSLSGLALRAQYLPVSRYTTKEGLISDRITAITQDSSGFIWLGSYFGLCRYDGRQFSRIELPESQRDKYVTAIAATGKKVYASFLFQGGLAEYENGKVQAYFIPGKDSLSVNEFTGMKALDDGSLLMANSVSEIYNFRNGRFKKLYVLKQPTDPSPTLVEMDDQKTIWLASENGLIVLPFPYQQEYHLHSSKNVYSLYRKNGQMVYHLLDGGKTLIKKAKNWSDAVAGRVQSSEGPEGNIAIHINNGTMSRQWLLLYNKGLLAGLENENSKTYPLPLDYSAGISSIFIDRERNIWIANEPGLIKVSNFNTSSFLFDEPAQAGGSIEILANNQTLISNARAFYRVEQNKMTRIPLRNVDDLIGPFMTSAPGEVWLGFWNRSIAKYHLTEKSASPDIQISDYNGINVKINTLLRDSADNIWAGGASGLFRMKNGKILQHFRIPTKEGHPSFINCVVMDQRRKQFWLGDNASGLIRMRYHQDDQGNYHLSSPVFISRSEGLKDSYIRSMTLDHKENLWVGTRFSGIFRLTETDDGKVIVRDMNKHAKLNCRRVTDIERQDTSAMWFATCNGAYRYLHRDGSWKHFSTSDGLLKAEVFSLEVDDANGQLWLLMTNGVTRIDLGAEQDIPPPLVSITGVSILGKNQPGLLTKEKSSELSYAQNSIGFQFHAASFIDERNITYRYRLKGYDNDWTETVNINQINYASLPPGDYEFEVTAANARGNWSTEPARFAFKIIRPFYASPWFLFLMITLAIFIIYFVRIQRLKQRYRIEKIRLNIARDLHDDIGSTLGSINILSQTGTRKLEQNAAPEVRPIFQKIGTTAETTLEAMDDIVWSINPERDKVQDLLIRMREFAIPVFEAADITFEFVQRGSPQPALEMNLKRNSFLIFKEAVYNVVKHSGCSHVRIETDLSHAQLEIKIIDNGKGFDKSAPTGRNGLKNMRSRADAVQGSFIVESDENGSVITFRAPIR